MKERLLKILEREELSSSQFADIIDVQRSRVSHVLTGRNKPNLEFLQRILANFQSLRAEWLLTGQGNMYKSDENIVQTSLFDDVTDKNTPVKKETKEKQQEETPVVESLEPSLEHQPTASKTKVVEKIIVYYSDKTFQELNP